MRNKLFTLFVILAFAPIAFAANFGPAYCTAPVTVSTTFVTVAKLNFSATYTSQDPCIPLGYSCPQPNLAQFETKFDYNGDDLLKPQFLVDGVAVAATVTENPTGVYWAKASKTVTAGSHNVKFQCKRKSTTTVDVTIDPSVPGTIVELRATAG